MEYSEKELELKCYCGIPFHLLHIRLVNEKDFEPEIFVYVKVIHGNFWNRLKSVFKIIFKVGYEEETDLMLLGWENIRQLRNFFGDFISDNFKDYKKEMLENLKEKSK